MTRHALVCGTVALGVSLTLLALVVIAELPAVEAPAALEENTPEADAAPATHQAVLRPVDAMQVLTGASDENGTPLTISCMTCHAMLEPDRTVRSPEALDRFHQGMHYQHGANTCLSCHDPDNYDQLRLVDGSSIPATESIRLCSQCHGPQRRDFDRAAHGGMTGHWQLSEGGRVRNSCVHCHDAHVPAFQGAIPAPAPRDRFLLPVHADDGAHP